MSSKKSLRGWPPPPPSRHPSLRPTKKLERIIKELECRIINLENEINELKKDSSAGKL